MKNHNIFFKKMAEGDLKQLHEWFQVSHVLKWYAEDKQYSLKEIQEKYLPRINDTSIPNFIIHDQDKPVGYIQFYCLTKYLPKEMRNHSLFTKYKSDELVGIDLFIADENYLRIGFSSEALALFVKTYLRGKFKAVLVDPLKRNTTAVLFFERNGFKHVMSENKNNDLMILELVNKM